MTRRRSSGSASGRSSSRAGTSRSTARRARPSSRYRRALADDANPAERGAGLREWGSGEASIASAALVGHEGAGPPAVPLRRAVRAPRERRGRRRAAAAPPARAARRRGHARRRARGRSAEHRLDERERQRATCASRSARSRSPTAASTCASASPTRRASTSTTGSTTRSCSSSIRGMTSAASSALKGRGCSRRTQPRDERAHLPGLARADGARPRPPVQALHGRRGAAPGRGARRASRTSRSARSRSAATSSTTSSTPATPIPTWPRRSAARTGSTSASGPRPAPARTAVLERRLSTLRRVPAIVIPYRGDAKRRLPSSLRAALAVAMLGDVVEAALAVGRVLVVTDDPAVVPPGAEVVVDPGAGLGAAVAAGLARVDGHALVVNADLPAATPDALRAARGRRPRARRGAGRDDERALASRPARLRAALRPGKRRSLPRACAVRDGLASRSSRSTSTPTPTSSASALASARARARSSPFRREGRPALGRGRRRALRAWARTTILEPGELTVIGNVGDDVEILGLHVSPDLDSLLYTLGGLIDAERGWGRADETWNALESAASWGGEDWFRLGDRDLGLHLVRTEALRDGATLSEVTAALARRVGLATRIVPATDDRLRTHVHHAGRDGSRSRSGSSVVGTRDEVDAVDVRGRREARSRAGCRRGARGGRRDPLRSEQSVPLDRADPRRRRDPGGARAPPGALRRRQPARRRSGSHRPGRPYAHAHGRRSRHRAHVAALLQRA